MQIAIAKRTINLIFFFTIIVLFSSLSLIATNTVFMFTDTIYNGVTVGDIPVGGLSVEEAKNRLSSTFNERTNKFPITVIYQTHTWSISAQDIELNINADALAAEAYNVGRRGNIFSRLKERYLTINSGYTVPLKLNYNQDKLYSILINIAHSIDRHPENASLLYKNTNLNITPEIIGYQVDLPKTLSDFNLQFNNNIPFTIELTVNEVSPEIVSQDFKDIDNLIAIYTTEFNMNNQNRYQNIAIAAKNINHILVRPGEIFSFNKYVGPRLSEYGYKEAPVFVEGKLVLDWGGGVCQVSTTLYNAVLLADMAIEERSPHFQPPSYVPLGQDAAVADNLLDFKFKNTSPYNIYITSEVYNNQITISVFGKNNPKLSVIHIEATNTKVLEPNTIIKQDDSLELGKKVIEYEGQKGFQVTTYRVKSTNGHEISREYLASDEFKPEDRIMRIGTKLLTPQPLK